MQNPGEELVGEYLRFLCDCEFVQYNLQTTDVQGEIDVVGINLTDRRLYVCEVAIHLVTGLQYVKNKRPDNIDRFLAKFRKDITYARTAFPDYDHTFMLWSPIVKNSPNAKHNQMEHVETIRSKIADELGEQLELVINKKFMERLEQLREFSGKQSPAMTSPICRLFQIEERLKRHLARNGR